MSTFLFLGEMLMKSFLIMLAALALVRLGPGQSSAQRSLVWTAAFLGLLLLPLTKLAAPVWTLRFGEMADRSRIAAPVMSPAPPLPPTPLLPEAGKSWREKMPGLATSGVMLWMAGMVGLLSRRLAGFVQLAQLRRGSQPESDPGVLALFREVQSAAGLLQNVELRQSPSCVVPLTWGSLRPILLVPVGVSSWPPGRLRSVFLHELAHIARRDWLGRCLAQAAAAVFWMNPLVWVGLRALVASQEQACDDRVMEHGVPPDEYTADLLSCARLLRRSESFAGLAMARTSTLEKRILALLDENRSGSRTKAAARWAVALVLLGALAVSASAQIGNGRDTPATAGAERETPEGTRAKAKAWVIPKIRFANLPMPQVAAQLQEMSRAADPSGKGLEVHYASGDPSKTLTLSLDNQTLEQVLSAIKTKAGLSDVAFTFRAIVLVDPSARSKAAAPEAGPSMALPAEAWVLPEVRIQDMTLPEAAAYLQALSKKVDPAGKGIAISCRQGWSGGSGKLILSLSQIPLSEALRYVASLSGCALVLGVSEAEFAPNP